MRSCALLPIRVTFVVQTSKLSRAQTDGMLRHAHNYSLRTSSYQLRTNPQGRSARLHWHGERCSNERGTDCTYTSTPHHRSKELQNICKNDRKPIHHENQRRNNYVHSIVSTIAPIESKLDAHTLPIHIHFTITDGTTSRGVQLYRALQESTYITKPFVRYLVFTQTKCCIHQQQQQSYFL